jgi:hypothetical protein
MADRYSQSKYAFDAPDLNSVFAGRTDSWVMLPNGKCDWASCRQLSIVTGKLYRPIAFVSHTYVVKPKKLGFNKHMVRPADQRALKKGVCVVTGM